MKRQLREQVNFYSLNNIKLLADLESHELSFIMAWLRERRLVGLPTSTATGTFVTDQSDVGKAGPRAESAAEGVVWGWV